ncbi:MAG: IPT/TIG domain-containing protein [Bryobacteraceae bacterium]
MGQATFAPVLNQVFFIGDGLTGTGSGSLQKFYVPAAATQLWLGLADSNAGGPPSAYGDNAGALSVSGTLNPVQPSPPSIASGGVVSASAFGEFTSISPGSWIEIYGSNLSVDSRSWGAADFNGVNAPTSLDETSVTIGGQAAFIDFISPGQVNALVPSNVATGAQPLTLTVENVTSTVYSIDVNPVEPGLDAPPSFNIGGSQYAVALFADGTYVLPEAAIPGLNSRPAQPGDEIVLYGIGFGPVTPDLRAGQLVQQANTLASDFSMSIGGVPVTNSPYFGLAPNYTGLYQFNIVVPANTGSGAVPLTFTVAGVAGTQTLYLALTN